MLVASLLASTQAQLVIPSEETKQVCSAEIRSHCLRPWRLTPGAITRCVDENRSRLTPPCQTFWDTARQCQAEMREVCGGLNPLTIRSCLREKAAEFSRPCQATLGTGAAD